MLIEIFNFIKKPGSGFGRTNIKFPTGVNNGPVGGRYEPTTYYNGRTTKRGY